MNVACPHCSQPITVPASFTAPTANCPSCQGLFTLPPRQQVLASDPAFPGPAAAPRMRSSYAAAGGTQRSSGLAASPFAAGSRLSRSAPSFGSLLFSFDGRIPRLTYWLTSIAVGVVVVGISTIPGVVAGGFGGQGVKAAFPAWLLIPLGLVAIVAIWISLALQVKRWHDRDKSGFWMFIGLIPLIGAIWQFVELGCLPGTAGSNQYGVDPTARR